MKVPQIVPETGVSADYWNEYMGIQALIEGEGFPALAESFREYPVKRYQERYPADKYEEVVTEQNRERVSRLDELASLANEKFTNESRFTESDYERLINEVRNLIYGDGENFYEKIMDQ